MFAFEEIWADYVNATDWSADATASKAVIFLVILTPPIALVMSRGRVAAVAMIALAALLGAFLGGMSLWLTSVDHQIEGLKFRVDTWVLTMGLIAVCWLAIAALSWRAFRAANVLRRQASEPSPAANVFD
jgi:hypothetical protein